jgi:hypothetical protein
MVPHFLLSYLPWNTLQCLHWKCMPEWKAVNMSFLMTKVGLNVLFSINQSMSHHNIMLLLPYVSQLSNVTSQLKDIYGLAQLLVLWWSWWHVVLTSTEGLLILYRSGIFAIDISIVNFQTCPTHRDDFGVYWKRQKRAYRSPSHPAKNSKSYAKCSRQRGIQASTCKDFWLISITFLTVAAGKNLINC